MNRISYYLLDKINGPRILDQNYLDILCQYYESGSKILHYDINISQEDFQELFKTIFNTLGLTLSQENSMVVFNHYLKLLMADAVDGHYVDLKWFIDHIYYLSVGISDDVSSIKYRDSISFIQQDLINKFSIEENLKEKASRKIYTKFMSKI